MAFDLNNPPGFEDGGVLAAGPATAAQGGPYANTPVRAGGRGGEGGPNEDIPAAAAPHGVINLNMEPDMEDEENMSGDVQPAQIRRRKFTSNEMRNAVEKALEVIAASNNGKLKKNSTQVVAATLGLRMRTVQRIWSDAKQQIAEGREVDVSHKKTRRVGRKPLDIDYSQISSIPLRERTTIRSLAIKLHVSVGTLHRRFKMGMIRRHSNTLKPLLKDDNKKARLRFCLTMLDQTTINTNPKFTDMHNIVHIDEKWFSMTKKSKKYYLLPDEDDPYRTVQNKNCIGKLMFLAVLAQPMSDEHGNEIFSGKLGIFPFVKEEPAARSSKNRPKGTMVEKSVIVTREVMKDYLINKVLPAITENWPEERAGETIFIQQDNARTHVCPTDPTFLAAVQETGLDIRLM